MYAALRSSWLCVPAMHPHNRPCTVPGIRLTGGSTVAEGRLEVFMNGLWGSVCSKDISKEVASVGCSQLFPQIGFHESDVHMVLQGEYLTTSSPLGIAMSDVICGGAEVTLQTCAFSENSDGCTDMDAVGLSCSFLAEVAGYVSLGEGDSPGEIISSALLTADHGDEPCGYSLE
eukprot:81341-Chlamydomonas_euryale.AAC.1